YRVEHGAAGPPTPRRLLLGLAAQYRRQVAGDSRRRHQDAARGRFCFARRIAAPALRGPLEPRLRAAVAARAGSERLRSESGRDYADSLCGTAHRRCTIAPEWRAAARVALGRSVRDG